MGKILTSANGYKERKKDTKEEKVKKTMDAMAQSLQRANDEGYISALDAIITALESDATPSEYTAQQVIDLINVIKANIEEPA